jgi:hypothetical protein
MPLSKITNPFLDPAGAARSNVYSPSANTIGIVTAGTERVRVDSSGRVGIGTVPSAWNLAANFEVGAASVVGNGPNAYFSANQYYDGAWKYKTDGFGTTLLQTNGNFDFYTAPTGLANATSTQTLRMRLAPGGDLLFNSGYGSVATAYGVRAWVNFNGSGTVAIRGSGNVSSITDNGTGDYTVNFTTAMPDANYCAIAIGSDDALNLGPSGEIKTRSTGSLRFETRYQGNNTLYDHGDCHVSIFR